MNDPRVCSCLSPSSPLKLHPEVQDTNCDAWKRLLDLIEQTAENGLEELDPRRDMKEGDWLQIVALPPSIAKLKSVKRLILQNSSLVRIPTQISEMTSLEVLDSYTSYCLHWYPYEITQCQNLNDSLVSTRALYGNYKYRPPFPRLPDIVDDITPSCCSVCGGPFTVFGPRQVWISLRVATDVLPLLVHACSDGCIHSLPAPAEGYISKPHGGGPEQEQPHPLGIYA